MANGRNNLIIKDIGFGCDRIARALIPESARVADAPKIMLNHRSKRILAQGLAASRQFDWFRYACPRTLSGNQFYELLGQLSVIGRAAVYRLEYKTRLCQSEHWHERIYVRCTPSVTGPRSMNLGLYAAHLWR